MKSHFQAKLATSKNLYIIKTSASIRTKFCTVIKTINAHNFDVALNNNGLQPVGPRAVEAFQRTDVDSTDYNLLLVEPRSMYRLEHGAECTA